MVAAGTYAAPVRSACQLFGGEVDDEFTRAADDVVGVPLRADRDVAHRGIGADRTGPGDGQQVIFVGGGAATDQYGRQRVDQRSRFPVFFHCFRRNLA